ncbi:MAG: DUF4339 domain-containing protein [Flavobacterium sp.]|nr:DUF4339 domain-containing protein [Flavobacterium sp.]
MIILIIVYIICCFLIAEVFGRRKHIGFWWSLIMLIVGFINGIIAIKLSPSAKNEQVKGTSLLLILGLISIIIIGTIPLVISIIDLNDYNPIIDNKASSLTLIIRLGISVSFILSGFYMTLLSIGKIINKNPKFYFENILTILKHKMYTILNKNLKYYINENENQSICFSFNELKDKQINENTLIWRKGLKKWIPASKLNEIHTIINFSPPPINENEYTIPDKNVTELKELEKNKILIIPFITFLLFFSIALSTNHYIHNWVHDVTNLYPNYHKIIAIKKEYVNANNNLFSSAFDSKIGLLYIFVGSENSGKYYSVMDKVKRIANGGDEKLTEPEFRLLGKLGGLAGVQTYYPNSPKLAQSTIDVLAVCIHAKLKKLIPILAKQGSVQQVNVLNSMMGKFDQAISQKEAVEQNYENIAKTILNPYGTVKEMYEGKVKVIGYTSRNYPIFDFNSFNH